jgi:hypothetical protein
MREFLQGTAPDGVLASLVVVRGFSECTQGFGYSALKLVGEPFVAFEQIELRLAHVRLWPSSVAPAWLRDTTEYCVVWALCYLY